MAWVAGLVSLCGPELASLIGGHLASDGIQLPWLKECPSDGPFMDAIPPTPVRQPTWPRHAQLACALLIVLGLGWFGYRWCVHKFQTRPTDIQPRDVQLVVDLNRADEDTLRQLPNVGPKLAAKILADRRANGPFRSVDDLNRVAGVGGATVEAIRPWVCVNDEWLDDGSGRVEPTFAAFDDPSEPVVRLSRKPTESPPWVANASVKMAPGDAPIDINTASAADLERLPGIGKILAARIVEERGWAPFRSVDDMSRVNGIGAKRMEQIRPFVRVVRP